MESVQPGQEKLDEWFNCSPEDRERMRGGQMPAQIDKLLNGSGCGWVALTPLFGLVGGLIGMVTGDSLAARLGMTGEVYTGLCAGIGLVAGYRFLKARAADEAGRKARQYTPGPVRNEVLQLKSQPDGTPGVRAHLLSSDGRTFTVMLAPKEFQIDGRYRIYYVDTAKMKGKAGTTRGQLFALGLEPAGTDLSGSGW